MRLITEEEWQSGEIPLLHVSFEDKRMSIIVDKISTDTATVYSNFDEYLDYLGMLYPTRFVQREKLVSEFNRAWSFIGYHCKRGAANKIFTGADPSQLPLSGMNHFRDHIEAIEVVDWLPSNAALMMYVGAYAMDTGIHYYVDDIGAYHVIENNARAYGVFLVWTDDENS